MLSINKILSSSDFYKQAFEEGLIDILENRTAGTFILACANIFQHPELLKQNKNILNNTFTHIKEYYQSCSRTNQQPEDAADDITVMKEIIAIGFKNLKPLQTRQLKTDTATYQLSFNQLRSFRPARMSSVKKICLNTHFNPDGFHFDKAFLKKEMFAEGEYKGQQIALLYNKFPFIEYHALLVVDKTQHHNQFLTRDYLDYIFQLQTNSQKNIPELVIAYNSIGAGASVNHLHFQVFLETKSLALFSSGVVHNGGTEPYPASCCVFTELEQCWHYLQQLHATDTPYNLVFKNNKIFCLPRKLPSVIFTEFNVSSYGWSEMAGVFTLNNKDIFNKVTLDRLQETMRSASAGSD